MRRLVSIFSVGFLFSFVAQGATKNVMLTGFWPPTNEMLRSIKANGKNWRGSGYDVYAYFPEYKGSSDRIGHGDFRVDFAATYNDFIKYTDLLQPIAIVSFGQGDGPWEIEGLDDPYNFTDWFRAGKIPSEIRVRVKAPIADRLKSGEQYESSLPLEKIAEAVNAIAGNPVRAWIDENGGAGDYLCGFTAYLGGWYHAEHSAPADPAYNAMAGFIHVNASTSEAQEAMEATLGAVVDALDQGETRLALP